MGGGAAVTCGTAPARSRCPDTAAEIAGHIAHTYYFARRFDRARGQIRVAEELDPERGRGWVSAVLSREMGSYDEAIAAFLLYLGEWPTPVGVLGHLGNTYARAGREMDARECLRELEERLRQDDTIGHYEVAIIHAGLGEKDEAFEWLDRAHERRDKALAYLKVDPPLDPLRSDPRFDDLLRRMGLPL